MQLSLIRPTAPAWALKRLAASRRAFAATIRNPGLRRAQLAFGAAWTAEAAFAVALGVVAFHDGGAAEVGVVAFLRTAPAAVITPFGTAFADRFRRDRVLAWTSLIRVCATGGAAAVLTVGGPHEAVYALAVIATAAFRLFRPAHSALLPGLCNAPFELSSANVVRGLLDSVSTLVGPLAAAVLLHVSSPEAVFVTSAALALASALLLLRLPYEPPPRALPQPLGRIAHEAIEGFRALRRYPDVGVLIGISLAQSLTQGFLYVFVVVISFDVLDTGASGVGVLMAALGVGAVISALGASMFVRGRRLAALEGVGVFLWGLPLTLSGALPYQPVVLVLMAVIGIGNALVDIGLHTLPARLVPEDLLARVFGVKASLGAVGIAIGSFGAPLAIYLLGIRAALVVLGLVAPAVAALAWRRLRAIDAAIAHRDDEIAVLSAVPMFRLLPMPAIDELAVRVDRIDVAAGEDIVNQGDHGDRFYVIDDGQAEVIADDRLIRTLRSGDSFGEIALLRDAARTATVRARTRLRLYALDRHHFLSAVNGYESSKREANALVLVRLSAFSPVH